MYQPRDQIRPHELSSALNSAPLNLDRAMDLLRSRWPSIAIIMAAAVVVALSYVFTATPYYTASTSILVDTRQSQVLNAPVAGDPTTIDTSYIDSQVEVLKSDDLLLSVAHKLHLDKDPSFLTPRAGLQVFIAEKIHQVLVSLQGPEPAPNIDQKLVETLSRNMKVVRLQSTYVLDISYTASNAVQAAGIANAIADAYLVGTLDARYAAARRAGEWAQNRSDELRQEATRTDMAVQAFRASNNIVGTSHGLMSEEQLSNVNAQLVQARAATAEAKAKLDQINKVIRGDTINAVVSDTMNSTVISRLRSQYLDLSSQYMRVSTLYGKDHQAAVELAAKMVSIKSSIADEVKRIAQGYKSDYEIALSRENSLDDSLNNLIKQNSVTGEAQVKLRNLEGVADSYRTLYNNFLDKVQQSSQQASFPISDARVISTAMPPDQKSSPKTLLLLVAALVGGLLVGVASAFVAEFLNSGYDNVTDLEESLGVKGLGVLPVVKAASETDLLRFVLNSPFSRYAETVRGVKVAIDNLRPSSPAQVIGVTSSLPREGKTILAANLANIAVAAGSRTLLIDADLRRRSLTSGLARDAKTGLLEALSDVERASLHTIALPSGLHFIPAVWNIGSADDATLLGAGRMSLLIEHLRQHFEYIIVDLAPVIPVNDARALAPLLDGVVYVVKWHDTTRRAVAEALSSAEEVRAKLIGCILSHANPTALRRTEVYRGRFYEGYHSDSREPDSRFKVG